MQNITTSTSASAVKAQTSTSKASAKQSTSKASAKQSASKQASKASKQAKQAQEQAQAQAQAQVLLNVYNAKTHKAHYLYTVKALVQVLHSVYKLNTVQHNKQLRKVLRKYNTKSAIAQSTKRVAYKFTQAQLLATAKLVAQHYKAQA